jgi:hypothetical protein
MYPPRTIRAEYSTCFLQESSGFLYLPDLKTKGRRTSSDGSEPSAAFGRENLLWRGKSFYSQALFNEISHVDLRTDNLVSFSHSFNFFTPPMLQVGRVVPKLSIRGLIIKT